MASKSVNIEKVIQSKSPKLWKRLPGFALRYLKKILHEDDLNETFARLEGVHGFDFCRSVLNIQNIQVTSSGLEQVPKEGKVILSCNHALGGMDALALVNQLESVRKDVKLLVNDILLNLEHMSGLFVGVNKHGKNTADSLNEVKTLFEKEQLVVVFPAGLVSRKKNGSIRDLEWKKTFITRARKNGTPIIPVFISGRMSNFFYNLANLRAKLGIKSNIEMLYLINEQYKLVGTPIHITFGDLINPTVFSKEKTDLEWAQWVKEKVYQLKPRKL